MLDVFAGLPVHVLVVHAAVVGVPLAAVVAVAVAVVPRWRVRFRWYAVVITAVMFVVTFIAKQSGETFNARLGQPSVAAFHVQLGNTMHLFALVLFVASVGVAMVHRVPGRWPAIIATVVVAAAASAAVAQVIRVGHSGSEAVWSDIVKNTRSPAN
jgi:hypothetical protein